MIKLLTSLVEEKPNHSDCTSAARGLGNVLQVLKQGINLPSINTGVERGLCYSIIRSRKKFKSVISTSKLDKVMSLCDTV